MNLGSLTPEALIFTTMFYRKIYQVSFGKVQIIAIDKGDQRKVRFPEENREEGTLLEMEKASKGLGFWLP